VELAKRARRLWPDRRLLEWDLFDAAAFQGNPADAEAMLRDPIMGPILQPAGAPPTLAHIARAMRTRLPVDIDAVSRDCRHFDAADSGRTLPCVLALSALGRIDDAFRLPRDEYWPAMLFWPQTAPMRADPRFQGLTEKLGLFAYWKDTRTRPDFCMVERVAVCQALSSVKG
jgi:hypothetical protein